MIDRRRESGVFGTWKLAPIRTDRDLYSKRGGSTVFTLLAPLNLEQPLFPALVNGVYWGIRDTEQFCGE